MPQELDLPMTFQSQYQAALQDFRQAREQAALQEVISRLTGKSSALLSYEEVARKLKLAGRVERGVQEIPLDAIVGSVGRYTDFTRTFLPRQDSDEHRWAGVRLAADPRLPSLPPIDVYQVGAVYFVIDGNHRVSVARQAKLVAIEAHVIEVHTPIPLTPDVKPDDLILKAEYADFLAVTCLGERCATADLSFTVPGQYEKLLAQIELHRYQLQAEAGRAMGLADAASRWYDEVYRPTVLVLRDRGLLRWFPGRTEADLYLWVAEHRAALEKELGWAIRPEAAVTDLAVRQSSRAGSQEAVPGAWRKTKITDRYTDRLFMDVLVPLNGTPESWSALDQALLIAQREAARLQGLHLVAGDAQRDRPPALAVPARFDQQCAAANVPGHLVVETGDVTRKICERALLADLVVINVAHPPAAGLSSLSSGLRTILWRCARPVLAVPGAMTPLDRALVAYDGSPKAKEALFVAAYLAERWGTALTVLAVLDGDRVRPTVLDFARAYLDVHEIPADFVTVEGNLEVVLKTIAERQLNLAILGGYSVSAVEEVMVGSAVNYLLRAAPCPLLICR